MLDFSQKKKKSKINNFIISGFLGLFACMCLICLASFYVPKMFMLCLIFIFLIFNFQWGKGARKSNSQWSLLSSARGARRPWNWSWAIQRTLSMSDWIKMFADIPTKVQWWIFCACQKHLLVWSQSYTNRFGTTYVGLYWVERI